MKPTKITAENRRKIALSKETVRALGTSELPSVVGGASIKDIESDGISGRSCGCSLGCSIGCDSSIC